MARFLALDWDHKQLHVVAAAVGGGTIRVQRAAVWQEEQSPNPAEAEAQGRLLRERLKSAGIAAAPVLFCIGRDRVILKDIRFPAVPAAEEPNVVRFQAVKEITEAAEDVVIDYVPSGEAGNGERRALVVVMRRELLATYQTLCKAAGLKLAGVLPRPFGSVACLKSVMGTTVLTPAPNPADAAVAVLTVSDRWAEFCVARGDTLLMNRSMAVGAGLASEVKRSLAVYAGQAPQQPVKALYLAVGGEHAGLPQRLRDLLSVPVHPLDPFAGSEKPELPAGNRGSFSGAVGLLHLQADKRPLPINFVKPREPKPPADPNKKRLIAAAALVAAVLVGGVSIAWAELAAKNSKVEERTETNAKLDKELLVVEEDAKRIKALGDWTDLEVCVLDELYDLTDRFPDPDGVRLTNVTFQQVHNTSAKDKNRHVATLSLTGIVSDDTKLVDDLVTQMVKDGHYRVPGKEVKPNTGLDRFRFRHQFTAKVDVEKVLPTKYTRRLPDPTRGTRREGADTMMDFGGFGGVQP